MKIRALVVAFGIATSSFAGSEIAPGVALVPGAFTKGVQPDGNTIIFRAPKGLIVVDTGRHVDHTQAIIDYAKAAHQPVAAIINTHWHLDHTGGNVLLRREYPKVRVYATSAIDDAMKGFLASYRAQLVDAIGKTADPKARKPWEDEVALIDAGRALGPDEVIAKSGKQSIAGHNLVLGIEHGATAGDIWVFDPASRVLASGDLITLPAPFLDTACPAKWKAALDDLDKLDFAVVVPGHGEPMHRREFETYRTAFGNLLTCTSSGKTKDECIAGWMSDAGSLISKEDPAFVRSVVDYYVDSLVHADPARTAKLCM